MVPSRPSLTRGVSRGANSWQRRRCGITEPLHKPHHNWHWLCPQTFLLQGALPRALGQKAGPGDPKLEGHHFQLWEISLLASPMER